MKYFLLFVLITILLAINVHGKLVHRQLGNLVSSIAAGDNSTVAFPEDHCAVCYKAVYDRAVNNQTMKDQDTIKAFACGHFTQMHNDCLINYVLEDANSYHACPICGQHLNLGSDLGNVIEDRKTVLFMKDQREKHGNTFTKVLKRWPRILEVGNFYTKCTHSSHGKVLDCAYYILENPDEEELLTSFMVRYAASPESLKNFNYGLWKPLGRLYNLKVYMLYGRAITISEAIVLSARSVIGPSIKQRLIRMCSMIQSISGSDESHSILKVPEIWAIREENMYISGVNMHFSILRATQFMKVSLLNTKVLQDGIYAISQAFVRAESKVDEHIVQHWPSLVELKNLGMWHHLNPKQHTIRYLAKMVINTELSTTNYKVLLNKYEAEALATKLRVVKFDKLSFEGLQQLRNFRIKDALDGSISMYAAIHFAMLPSLPRKERAAWKVAINKNFLSILTSFRPLASRIVALKHTKAKHQSIGKAISATHDTFNEVLEIQFDCSGNYRQRRFVRDSTFSPAAELSVRNLS